MQRPGSTVGRVSNSFRSWGAGDVLTVPEGELKHIGDRMYETRVERPESSSGARYQVRQSGSWHVVYDTVEDEKVEGESERDEEAAQANADRLNS